MKNQWYPIKQQGNSYVFIDVPKITNSNTGRAKAKTMAMEDNHIYLARSLQISFGKYAGHTLGDIIDKDKQYFKYLKEKSTDRELKNACEILNEAAA